MASGAKLGLTGVLALIVLLVAIWDKKNEEIRHRRTGESAATTAANAPASVTTAPVEPRALAARNETTANEAVVEAQVRSQPPTPAPAPLEATPVSPEDGPSEPISTAAPPAPTVAPTATVTEPSATTPAPAGQPQPAPTRTVTHAVGKSETLYGLAQRYLGNGSRWPKLLAANQDVLSTPEALRPGMVLKIPGVTAPAPVAVAPAPAAATPRQVDTELMDTYRVQAGDTLSSIAQDVLGSAGAWQRLYEANRDHLQSPELQRQGQQLRIPKPE